MVVLEAIVMVMAVMIMMIVIMIVVMIVDAQKLRFDVEDTVEVKGIATQHL